MYVNNHRKGKQPRTVAVTHVLDNSTASQYWLGYIYANGNFIMHNGQAKILRIVCMEEDATHIAQLAQYLGSHAKPYKGKRYTMLNIYSEELVTILVSLGCTATMKDRTFTPDSIHLVTSPLFWRGYCDGNGIVVTGVSRTDLQLRVQTYPGLARFWHHYLHQYIDEGTYHIIKMKDRWEDALEGEQAYTIIRALYRWDIADRTQMLFAPHMHDAVSLLAGESDDSFVDALNGNYKEYSANE